MKTPVRKPDGEMRPRLESREGFAGHLRRFLSPRLGKKLPGEVTKHDIATLSKDIVAGKFGVTAMPDTCVRRSLASSTGRRK
jgi:hypothetical protein